MRVHSLHYRAYFLHHAGWTAALRLTRSPRPCQVVVSKVGARLLGLRVFCLIYNLESSAVGDVVYTSGRSDSQVALVSHPLSKCLQS